MKEALDQRNWRDKLLRRDFVAHNVARTLGPDNILPIETGYSEKLRLDENIDNEINASAERLLVNQGMKFSAMPMERLSSILRIFPNLPVERVSIPRNSDVVDLPVHVETMRTLLAATGNTRAEDVVAYQYVQVKKSPDPSLTAERLRGFNEATTENCIVGLGYDANGLGAVGMISLEPAALEVLSIADATMRLEPEFPLEESNVPATLRVYDLVRADEAMLQLA